MITARQVADWYNSFGSSLFDKNIRNYKGDTDVNKGIETVIRENPEDFFYYNNGIKVLCKRISKKTKGSTSREIGTFSLQGVSLVNGAQTTGTLAAFANNYPNLSENLDKAKLFVQFIDLETAPESYFSLITRYSNTQNRIDNKDFASLDPLQEKIRTDLSFHSIMYLYKSGSTIDNPKNQISLDEMIIARACLSDDIANAVYAKSNIGRFTEDVAKPMYKLIFNDGINLFEARNAVIVLRNVEGLLKHQQNKFSGREKTALVHGNRIILHIVLQHLKNTAGFKDNMIATENLEAQAKIKYDKIAPVVQKIVTTEHLDSYPVYIFKNITKCKNIAQRLDETLAEDL
ncbi:hypothetical protein FACS1894105_11050 [Clostridia bacterium]|nr:hypothetical protein FACS1894105_11050 [Clostridia bacterium]